MSNQFDHDSNLDNSSEGRVESKPDVLAQLAKASRSKKSSENARQGVLMVDVYQTEDDIIIKSTLAGVTNDNIDVSVTADMVTIRGVREAGKEIKEGDYYYRELYWGSFSRSIILPVDVDADKAVASMKNGILTIKMPKLEKTKTRRLRINV